MESARDSAFGFTRPQSSLKSARNNLEGVQQHPDVVSDYLHSEVLMGRMVGLFSPRAIPHVLTSRFGVIQKGPRESGDL